MTPQPPRVFVGHASADRDAFVEPLARALAGLGVQAWVEFWEVRLGDRLAHTVFDRGMDTADCFVLVLSDRWTKDPWLADQLDGATVRRIEDGRRLIPVLLDGMRTPPALRHLVPLRADRTAAAAAGAAAAIADTVHGADPRPPVAAPPGYAATGARTAAAVAEAADRPFPAPARTGGPPRRRPPFPGVAAPDLALLHRALREALARGVPGPLPWAPVREAAERDGLAGEAPAGALRSLEAAGLMTAARGGGAVAWCALTPHGYRLGAPGAVPDLEGAKRRVIAALLNRPPGHRSAGRDTAELAETADAPVLVADRLLADLAEAGHLRLLRGAGGRTLVADVSPLLARWIT
ncbi:toll/interleukin-1 receptor domain-containing protein [Streptomyces sp. CS62]|uniref:toll/interleukin-1 receptor domain-containing protein n=1 Tax=Streptomyces sp. CS62 TaxID=3119268 RepID=UPI002F958E85